MDKAEFKKRMDFINKEIKEINKTKSELINQYIEDNKPCNYDDLVLIVLGSGRKAKGKAQQFGIMKTDADNDVFITSYIDANDNKTKYITVPTQSVTVIQEAQLIQ